jgi:CxxC-x17-CxxC domain-containing protein
MMKTGEYGEFPPGRLSSFGYNDSQAQEHYPLTKEQAIKLGFNWNDVKNEKAEKDGALKAAEIPAKIGEVADDIVQKVIECARDGKLFKIVGPEFAFYKKYGLPLPHLCPDCRHFDRKSKINPRKLYGRKCAKCGAGIQTTFAPERPEIVYCEKCYLEAVY